MPTQAQYHQRRKEGLCTYCGGTNDQPPYRQCSHCYTPHPKPCPFSQEPDYQKAYAWHRQNQGHAPLEIACCGRWHAVTDAPSTVPCCGRVFEEKTPDAT